MELTTLLIVATYGLLLAYSTACSPPVFFRLFRFRDTPEYEFAYLVTCILMAVTLLGAVARIAFVLHDKRRAT